MPHTPSAPANPAQAVSGLDADKIATWPPLKKAIWDVVTFEQLNDGHYINAYDLTDKLHFAVTAANPAQVTDAMVEAASAKYREIGARCNWQHSWPSEEAFREILTAAIGAGGQAVASLEWIECKALGGGRKLIALDCFHNEFHRIDLPKDAEAVYRDKEMAQRRYDRCILSALSQPDPADERVVEALHLTEYEIQVLLGTSISGCNMSRDRVFSLDMAWHRLHALGLIDRTDGLAIITKKGTDVVATMLAALAQEGRKNG